ncbi:MAG: hypothetical protein ACTSRK_11215 [Promethearchaeota archaeon]
MALSDQRYAQDFHNIPISDLTNQNQGLLNRQMLQKFTHKIKNCFPTCVATVLADAHGFPLYSEIEEDLDENLLALTAIAGHQRHFLDLSKYHKIIKPVGADIHMVILLKKARENYVKYGTFERLIKGENLSDPTKYGVSFEEKKESNEKLVNVLRKSRKN